MIASNLPSKKWVIPGQVQSLWWTDRIRGLRSASSISPRIWTLFGDEAGSARWVRTAWWLLLAALLFSVAAVTTFGRRILVEWLGL